MKSDKKHSTIYFMQKKFKNNLTVRTIGKVTFEW
jgi:hypothetical protein